DPVCVVRAAAGDVLDPRTCELAGRRRRTKLSGPFGIRTACSVRRAMRTSARWMAAVLVVVGTACGSEPGDVASGDEDGSDSGISGSPGTSSGDADATGAGASGSTDATTSTSSEVADEDASGEASGTVLPDPGAC